MIRKFKIFTLTILLSSMSFGSNLCVKSYLKKDLKARFEEAITSRSNGFFPLVLADFIKAELKELTDIYQEQMSNLKISGTASELNNELSLFRTQTASIEKEIENLNKNLAPGAIKRIFITSKRLEKNLNSEVEKLLNCKKGFDNCSASLEKAINDSGEGLKKIENLIDDLSKKSDEIAELYDYVEKNQHRFGHSVNAALQIFETEIKKIHSIIINSKTALEAQSKILAVAYLRLSEDVPEIEFKLRELAAKGAAENILTSIKPRVTVTTEELFGITKASERNIETARTFYNVISALPNNSISGNQLPDLIMSLIPHFGITLYESSNGRFLTNPTMIDPNTLSSIKLSDPDFRLFALYTLVDKIAPSKSKSVNIEIMNSLTQLMNETTVVTNRNLPYQSMNNIKRANQLLTTAIGTKMAKFITTGN